MNGNAEMLNYVYQNSQMGIETIKQLLDIVEQEAFKKCLNRQLSEYKDINMKAKKMLHENGYDEKGIGEMEKLTTYWMINMKTLMDKSASHISEMMIKGSNMGIIDAMKKINEYEQSAEKNVVSLMKELLKTEENNVKELKEYI